MFKKLIAALKAASKSTTQATPAQTRELWQRLSDAIAEAQVLVAQKCPKDATAQHYLVLASLHLGQVPQSRNIITEGDVQNWISAGFPLVENATARANSF